MIVLMGYFCRDDRPRSSVRTEIIKWDTFVGTTLMIVMMGYFCRDISDD